MTQNQQRPNDWQTSYFLLTDNRDGETAIAARNAKVSDQLHYWEFFGDEMQYEDSQIAMNYTTVLYLLPVLQ